MSDAEKRLQSFIACAGMYSGVEALAEDITEVLAELERLREGNEKLGFALCEWDAMTAELERLRAERDEMRREIEVFTRGVCDEGGGS